MGGFNMEDNLYHYYGRNGEYSHSNASSDDLDDCRVNSFLNCFEKPLGEIKQPNNANDSKASTEDIFDLVEKSSNSVSDVMSDLNNSCYGNNKCLDLKCSAHLAECLQDCQFKPIWRSY